MIYTDKNRGHIQHNERARQIVAFDGLKYGNITPTDIDGFIEKSNEAFIFFELKYKDAELPAGQKTALIRLVDNLQAAGKKSVLFVGRHEVGNPDVKVIAGNTLVTDFYFNGCWHKGNNETLQTMIDRFIKWAVPFY